ncbi:unnamed protein product, partial [Didymodactylos carnosus]
KKEMASGDQHSTDAHDHDSDDDTSTAIGYKPPQKVHLETLLSRDADDSSLDRYKKQLLGNDMQKLSTVIDANDPRLVIPLRISLIFENHEPNVVFDLNGSIEHIRQAHSKRSVTIKEGESYRIQLEYYVQRDIVTGLSFTQKIKKAKTITVDRTKYMIGSRAPSPDLQTYLGEVEVAPSGVKRQKMLLENDQFLLELTKLFQQQRVKNVGSLLLNMKRYDGRTKPKPRDKKKQQNQQSTSTNAASSPSTSDSPATGAHIEYKCLLHAKFGSKKLSTVVSAKDVNRFQLAYSNLLKANMDTLKKKEKEKKTAAAAVGQATASTTNVPPST